MNIIRTMDQAVALFFARLEGGALDGFMVFFTTIGTWGAVWLVVGVLLLFLKTYRRYGWMVLLAVGLGALLGEVILKNVIARDRPFISMDLPIIISPPGGYSFPSGHAASSFAAAFVLSRIGRPVAAASFTVAALIAFSRVYLLVHYISDMISGMILGVICAVFVLRCGRVLSDKRTGNPKHE